MQRRRMIAGSSALFATAIVPIAAAAAPVTVTTQLQWIKDVQNAGWWIADARGYFREAGIVSNVLAGGPSLASVEAVVAAGRADVGIDQFERIVDANTAGTDFVILGALYQRNPAALMSLPAHPIRSARDIIGKRLGLQQGAKIYLDAIMRVNGLPAHYTEVVVGSTPEPLLEGACDGYLCFVTNQPLTLAARGIATVTATFDQLGYETYTDCLFCTREYLQKNRAALVHFLHALQRGWNQAYRDPVEGAHLTTTTYGAALGLDEKVEIAVSRAQVPLMQSALTHSHGPMWIDERRITGPIYRTLRATGRTALPDVAHLVDLSPLAEASRS